MNDEPRTKHPTTQQIRPTACSLEPTAAPLGYGRARGFTRGPVPANPRCTGPAPRFPAIAERQTWDTAARAPAGGRRRPRLGIRAGPAAVDNGAGTADATPAVHVDDLPLGNTAVDVVQDRRWDARAQGSSGVFPLLVDLTGTVDLRQDLQDWTGLGLLLPTRATFLPSAATKSRRILSIMANDSRGGTHTEVP